jgi:hypothetical protein
MQLLTTITLLVGVLAVIASWVVAVRLIESEKASSPLTTTSHDAQRKDDVLAEAHLS